LEGLVEAPPEGFGVVIAEPIATATGKMLALYLLGTDRAAPGSRRR